MTKKKTVIVGATTNPARYAYFAAELLTEYGHEIIPIGIKKGKVADVEILNIREFPVVDNIHTITLYLGPQNQAEWYDYMLSLNPKRIIFNPGTENSSFAKIANEQGIETLEACTLVMLRVGNY